MKALSVAEAIGEGIVSVPETLLDGIIRTGEGLTFWDTEEEMKIGAQNERAYKALKEIFKYGIKNYNSPIERAIRIIIYNFYESLPKSEKQKIIDIAVNKGIVLTSKVLTSVTLSTYISGEISEKIVAHMTIKTLLKYTMSAELTLLAMQGLLYKAGAASDRLKKKFPKIYFQLRRKNLDMVYFLIEKPMKKYLEVIRLNRMKLHTKLVN